MAASNGVLTPKRLMRRLRRQRNPLDGQLREVERFAQSGAMPFADYRFTFVVGASGSGTTLLTKLLSYAPNAVCLGGKYWTVSEADEAATAYMRLFNKAIVRLWDRHGTFERRQWALEHLPVIVDRLLQTTSYRDCDTVIYKRSAPFNVGDRYRPDLHDLFELFDDPRVVVIYRDPCASTYSSLRRGFADSMRQMATICEEQLTLLAAQLATLPAERRLVVNYESLCATPERWIQPLADFSAINPALLREAVAHFEVNAAAAQRWQEALPPAEAQYLDRYFSERRRRQWALLAGEKTSR